MRTALDKPMRVCAVFVTYNPQPSVVDHVRLVRSQVEKIVIIDNGSSSPSQPLLAELEKIPDIHLIRNPQNLGIAAALNTGIREAIAADFAWVVTFDQDSAVTPEFCAGMFAAYETCPFKDRVALISPVHCGSQSEWARKSRLGATQPYSLFRVAMTSGSFIKTRAFQEVGWYDEGMFIDYVDYDFCLRLWQKGWKVIRSNRSCLWHRLGSLEKHSLLGFPINIKTHSALRRYYIMRNRVVMYRRYTWSFPVWTLKDIGWLLLDFVKITLFEQDKAAKLQLAFKGLRHGFAGRSGPLAQTAH